MKTQSCPFCSARIKEISFLESESFLAIYNRSPVLPGHSLIIPKKHYTSMLELSPEERFEMTELGVKAIKGLLVVFQAVAFDWTVQEGEPAGQTIPHLHVHLLPRHPGDLPRPGDWYPRLEKNIREQQIDSDQRPAYSHEQLIQIAKKSKGYFRKNE